MKKKSLFLVVIAILAMMILVLSGCSESLGEIKTGVYYSRERLASLTIGEDESFVLNRDIATSYNPTGTYTIEGDKLLLKSNEGIIEFKISDDMLIFESGEIAESLIKKGTEFIYEDNKEERDDSLKWDLIPMVMVDDNLYLDTGYESVVEDKAHVIDGEITLEVDGSEKPFNNDQSNFGTGYEYKYGEINETIEIFINGKWWIFATEQVKEDVENLLRKK